ncbi:MAG: proton-conducting transporter membrane subunit [Alphaproteobacteria bacterium]
MIKNFFNMDLLAMSIIILVVLIGVTVGNFASRYMKGDNQYCSFFIFLTLLIAAVTIMVSADNMVMFFGVLAISNALLTRLMVHKANWKAAKASGVLTAKIYLFGVLSIAIAFLLLYNATGLVSIQAVIQTKKNSPFITFALILLILGAMAQSAIWPFHKWLISSLNSPTPVSAIMHAGIVNGGGFLLVRFAPLYLRDPGLLTIIFIIGLTTATLGTFWKLMQNDVKRMLACSTMGQMGFMIVQCGLGLFPAAVAHLIFHGMFKAYLFLASGNAVKEQRLDLGYPPTLLSFVCSLLCGIAGSYGFAVASNKLLFAQDTNIVLIAISFIAGCQFALAILKINSLIKLPVAVIATLIIGLIYGTSIHLIESFLAPLNLMQPQTLNFFHIIGIFIFIGCWLGMLFYHYLANISWMDKWIRKLYVKGLNSSQPHPTTITYNRNQYKYL